MASEFIQKMFMNIVLVDYLAMLRVDRAASVFIAVFQTKCTLWMARLGL